MITTCLYGTPTVLPRDSCTANVRYAKESLHLLHPLHVIDCGFVLTKIEDALINKRVHTDANGV